MPASGLAAARLPGEASGLGAWAKAPPPKGASKAKPEKRSQKSHKREQCRLSGKCESLKKKEKKRKGGSRSAKHPKTGSQGAKLHAEIGNARSGCQGEIAAMPAKTGRPVRQLRIWALRE
jgi:hypothetical protein